MCGVGWEGHLLELINNALCEGIFRANHYEVDFVARAPLNNLRTTEGHALRQQSETRQHHLSHTYTLFLFLVLRVRRCAQARKAAGGILDIKISILFRSTQILTHILRHVPEVVTEAHGLRKVSPRWKQVATNQ